MKRTLIFSVIITLFGGVGMAQLSVKNSSDDGNGLSKGDLLVGAAPCFAFQNTGNPDSNQPGSNSNDLGLKLSGDYFLSDNLSVGANLGVLRQADNFGDDSKSVISQVGGGLSLNFYPPNCFCDGEPNDARFRPFGGLNANFHRGTSSFLSDNFETETGIQDLDFTLSAGVLVNLNENIYMGVEGNILGVNNSQSFNKDTGDVFSQSNNFFTTLNKALWSVNFAMAF
ncbi:MAG: hypothetical protein MRZ79_17065 [Bacteroidia bacterium]|nr:hypothetical protein [Bacteroidia bacterium]